MVKKQKPYWLSRTEKDLAVVRSKARIVFEISPNGEIEETINLDPTLNVIAVIGKGLKPLGDYPVLDKALLVEIGLGRSRPYQKSYIARRFVSERRKFYSLSKEQYLLVAPHVFGKLLELAAEQISCWKSPTFCLPTPKTFYRRRDGKMLRRFEFKAQPRGVRFSLDLQDENFVSDVYWAELRANRLVKKSQLGLANFIAMCLSAYRSNGRSSQKFCQLKLVQPVLEVLSASSLPKYLIIEMFRYLPNGMNYHHLYHLAEAIDWDLSPTEAHKKARSAFPDANKRIKDLQLRVDHEKNGHLVFELFPPLVEKKISRQEEVPF